MSKEFIGLGLSPVDCPERALESCPNLGWNLRWQGGSRVWRRSAEGYWAQHHGSRARKARQRSWRRGERNLAE